MKRVLVTGASGFLGTHCLAALAARGWTDVHAVSRTPRRAARATWHSCDLFDPRAAEELLRAVRPTHVLHLAWCTTPGRYWTSPENLRWLAASVTLLEEFARAGGRRFVAAGSCAEYAWRNGSCSESTTPLAPATPYGAAKHAFQVVLSSFAPTLGISTAWGRIFLPYGPHEHPDRLVAYVIRSLLAGTEALCTSGEQRRDFVYGGDVADAFAVLLDSELSGPVNIGSGEPVEVRSVISAVGEHIGRPELVRFGARPLPAGEPELLAADISRLRQDLGWRPRISLRDGIAAAVEYWRHG